jgi:hypothetical protein
MPGGKVQELLAAGEEDGERAVGMGGMAPAECR